MRWSDGIADSVAARWRLSKLREMVKDGECCSPQGREESDTNKQTNSTLL